MERLGSANAVKVYASDSRAEIYESDLKQSYGRRDGSRRATITIENLQKDNLPSSLYLLKYQGLDLIA